mmetsp:Transcript_94936/g.188021  ORF Transcript_94936/g.188021 Transcript_94936/m.188021 type:complete len:311 (+) Transcript_94936:103-1035(+)
MGNCARCSDMQRVRSQPVPDGPRLGMEKENLEGASDGSQSEIAASSEDESDKEQFKQGVEEVLKTTGKTLKRGKTMAMQEAILTAKKVNIEASKVEEAERQLDQHKRKQRREEMDTEAKAFFASASAWDRLTCERLLRKAQQADANNDIISKLQDRLNDILITRELEHQEIEQARERLRESCRSFVAAASSGGGHRTMLLDLNSGRRIAVLLRVDPPLQFLQLEPEDKAAGLDQSSVSLSSLTASVAKEDKAVSGTAGFNFLDIDDAKCAVLCRSQDGDNDPEMWCFVEKSATQRDWLIEAVVVLSTVCS